MTREKRIEMEQKIIEKIENGINGSRLTEKEFNHCFNKRFFKELVKMFKTDCFDCFKIEGGWYLNYMEDSEDVMDQYNITELNNNNWCVLELD